MIQELNVQGINQTIRILVIRSARKSLGLEVRDQNTVFARIPARLLDRELKQFVEAHREWILEKTKLTAQREENRKKTPAPPLESLSKTDRMKIQLKIGKRVRHYCEVMGVTVGRVTVKNQKTRWGSCSAKGNVNFNYQLAFMPEELLDYVVIHELAHRRHMDHSREFWAEVEKYCPDYKKRREELKNYCIEG
ncbi:M48 family peptidase [Clostridium sp. OM02-18AC]|uniref:M48 family metallopeptidase n=1 Tax=Clostridium sp. OM02-18AC TaxID=2292311 RepID=UPI000E4C3283|nr:M48 family metallopeptidase [Clostridium sp. OM02-18AC]RHV64608.1 M48 family peptidase [Clostridium sp. OM02-18AC]